MSISGPFYVLGMNFSPLYPPNFGDFSQNISTPADQQQPLAQNPSGRTEYMAFPKPFESSSSIGAEKQRYLTIKTIISFTILSFHLDLCTFKNH